MNIFNKKTFKNDLIAGIVVALVSIPISMGYAQIAGLPVVYGLYCSILPVLIYGLITSSPQFVFGVDATPAALVGSTLATLGIATGSEEALRLVPVITMVSAAWLLCFYIFRAGRIVNYISTPVMGGFISGIGVTIILMQVCKLFGGNAGTGELFELVIHIGGELKHFNLLSCILGVGTVVICLVSKKLFPKFPMSVLLMGLGAMATALFHIEDYGVKLLPEVAAGFPKLMIPDFSLIFEEPKEILVLGLSIAGVVMAQTLLATNNYANRYDYKVNNNREIIAYSASNAASAILGGCPLNGSVSRTGIADQYGCRSQLMSITATVVMLFVVAFGTPLLKYLPVPILTGIVIAALIGIIEYKLAIKLFKSDYKEFLIFLGAFLGVLVFGTIWGVLIGVILSFVDVVIRAVVPPKAFLGIIPGHEGFYSLSRYRNARAIKDTVIYSFNGTLFFANVATFEQDIEDAIDENTKRVIIDAGGIGEIDITAADRLLGLNRKLKDRGIRFYITEHDYILNDKLRTLGAGSLVEEGVARRTISLALRDSGVEKPYPLEGGEVAYDVDQIEASEKLAEIEWAFGKDADIWLEKMAAELESTITDDENEEITEAEAHNSWGRLGLFDEDGLLERLEMRLSESATKSVINLEEIEKKIEERRVILEEKLSKLNPEAIHLLKEHRIEALAKFKEHNPEGYEHMMEQRRKHLEHLKKRDPELAKKLEVFYDSLYEKDN